jgi:pilus assembly protein CpaC
MYVNLTSRRGCAKLILVWCAAANLIVSTTPGAGLAQQPLPVQPTNSVVHKVTQATERLEMTVNTSQILTLGARIPRIVVNNPELVTARPISENQIQIAARKSGVTQINLWDEKGQIYTIDLLIFGDVRELEVNLKRMFPSSSIRVVRLTNSLVLEGQVDRPEIVTTIRQLAEDYAPKIINNMTVGGAQQILLKVKVMEVSRTKLRNLGIDFSFSSSGGFFTSTAGGILPGDQTIDFGVFDGGDEFLATIEALQQNRLVKTLANPTLVTVSGRPASFNSGGEIFFQINNGVSGSTVESEKFGTLVHFVPIVLGDGRIRLEVRPTVSELDSSAPIGGELFRTKISEVDTGVEMQAGQTLAIAGLIQTRVNSTKRGLPYISDVPYLGVPFRRVSEEVEEVELLIFVTPEFADAMDPHEVPLCGPGMETMSPTNCELYFQGKVEVPACGPCGASEPCRCNAPGMFCEQNGFGPCGGPGPGQPVMATDGGHMQMTPSDGPQAYRPGSRMPDPAAGSRPQWQTAATPSSPYTRQNPNPALVPANRTTSTPGLIGPIGYDVQK